MGSDRCNARTLIITGDSKTEAAFRMISQDLSDHLWSSFRDPLPKYDEITWMKDDVLLGLSIAALISAQSSSRYLVEDYRLLSAASVTELTDQAETRVASNLETLALARPAPRLGVDQGQSYGSPMHWAGFQLYDSGTWATKFWQQSRG